MRALVLLLGIAGGLGITLAYPYVGVLLWSWFTLQQPHQEAYGFVETAPLNLIIAVVTLGAWFLSRERKTPPSGFIFWMLVIFFVWMTFNSFFAYDPALVLALLGPNVEDTSSGRCDCGHGDQPHPSLHAGMDYRDLAFLLWRQGWHFHDHDWRQLSCFWSAAEHH